MASSDTALLGTFQKHIEDMRNLSLCKICIKPFYEPFILACGHTYCYSCLTSWFTGPHNHEKVKKCPDCRAEVTAQPSPNYLLRDMVHMFINRAELLPEDETVEEHQQAKDEEAKILAADRIGQGLFKNVFNRRARRYGMPELERMARIVGGPIPMPIRDQEDGVMRCPTCAWELEDGECLHCGYFEGMAFDSDQSLAASGSDPMDDLDSEEEYGSDQADIDHNAAMAVHFHGVPEIDLTEDSDSDESIRAGFHTRYNEDEDEDEDEMNSFIDDDDDLPNEVDDEDHDDDDDDDESEHTITGILEDGMYAAPPFSSDVESDGEGYESGHVPDRPQQRFYGVTNDSPSASSESDDDNTAQEDSANDTTSEQATNYDYSDDDSVQEVPPPILRTSRQRLIVDSDEEEEDTDDDEDDEPIRPPQNSLTRRQRLNSLRARRAHSQESQHRPGNQRGGAFSYGQRGAGGYDRASNNFDTTRRSRPHIMRVY